MKRVYTGFEMKNNLEKYSDVETKLISGYDSDHIPFITIIIPTYRRTDVLKDSIESVLNQIDYSDFEVIVIDNDENNNTETERLMNSYADRRVFYYKNEKNIGQIGNWNRGILLARSEWIVLLHDDDYLKPMFLKKITDVLKSNSIIQGIFTVPINEYIRVDGSSIGHKCRTMRIEKGEAQLTNESNTISHLRYLKKRLILNRQNYKKKFKGNISKLKFKDYYFDSGIFAPTGGVYKRENVLELGGFSEEAFPLSDWDFHLRYINRFNLFVLFEELIVTRMGINDSMKKEIRIGFIEKGLIIRKQMQMQMTTMFGNWWIQIVCLRHALGFHNLSRDDLKNIPLNDKYCNKVFRFVYFAVIYFYSKHLKFYVPLFESRNVNDLKDEKEINYD